MKKFALLLIACLCLCACKSSKNNKQTEIVVKKPKTTSIITENKASPEKTKIERADFITLETVPLENQIIDYAKSFQGVKYRFGGTDNKGMDCSGLIFESFRAHEIYLPRISRDMAKQGDKISLKDTKKGDLLFFKTGNRRNSINHVGLVVEIADNTIYFIHATSSKGVIISSLNENYWLNSFSEARSLL